ncbi:MAG: UvrD-helicase domain-containing protein [Helicobacter sp.]|nr:UvrD-helicase domain-containing protein [Helicobacter sp.]
MQSQFLEQLNPAQLEAIKHTEGALLILAGAGSGKTKTITTRLAYLIDEIGIPPDNTLTLTFTNKAANEMQRRALEIIEKTIYPPLLCTFHKFGLIFLRLYIANLSRKADFVLIDSDDQKRILKEINKELVPLPLLMSEISRMKNSQITPQQALKEAHNDLYEQIAKFYQEYQDFLLSQNRLDFDDLLLLPLTILQENPKIAKNVSEKYQYLMVDEYQDTNEIQYLLLKQLCTTHSNICVVGDDDQSIYSWRGANIHNILNFSEYFKGAKIIKLEENYRSTQSILEAANRLIANNKERLGKNLISTKGEGKAVEIIHASNEQEEVQKIIAHIQALHKKGIEWENIAILFRLNALSRTLEEGFNKAQIPYTLVGAIRFYERSEIKDILSYFRLLVNLNDDFSLFRIINKPRRGIGKTSIEKLQNLTQAKEVSVFELISNPLWEAECIQTLSKKTHQTLKEFFGILEDLQASLQKSSLNFLAVFEEKIGLCKALSQSNEEIDRVSNIEEFFGLYREYMKQNPLAHLEDFLNELALRSDQEDTEIRNQNKGIMGVSCMSVHSSKGLEFDYLFVMGLEEGFFPIIREDSNIQEERRLGYVAFTRAKKELYLSYVDSRFYRGNRSELLPSRFLGESGILQKKPVTMNFKEVSSDFKRGDCVIHKIFGAGRIVEVEKDSKDTKLKINFGGLLKTILSDFVEKV